MAAVGYHLLVWASRHIHVIYVSILVADSVNRIAITIYKVMAMILWRNSEHFNCIAVQFKLPFELLRICIEIAAQSASNYKQIKGPATWRPNHPPPPAMPGQS